MKSACHLLFFMGNLNIIMIFHKKSVILQKKEYTLKKVFIITVKSLGTCLIGLQTAFLPFKYKINLDNLLSVLIL